RHGATDRVETRSQCGAALCPPGVLRHASGPPRRSRLQPGLMRMPKRFLFAYGLCVVLVALAPAVLNDGALRFATEFFLILTMAQMWNLLAGYAGLVSFGHQVFVAMGAYALFLVS